MPAVWRPASGGIVAHGLRPSELGRRHPLRPPPAQEDPTPSVPTEHPIGRSLASRRAVLDVVRAATLGSYGVSGFAANPIARLAGALGLSQPGVRLDLRHGIVLDMDLTVAYGLPVAEVARQVESAVRYAVRRSLGRELARLTIHVEGLAIQPASIPPRMTHGPAGISPAELAESGTDVA